MDDLIRRKSILDKFQIVCNMCGEARDSNGVRCRECYFESAIDIVEDEPSAQPTLYGYNIEHLVMIARVLQKEDLPPERVAEALTDIGRIVSIVIDELEETLRREVDQ